MKEKQPKHSVALYGAEQTRNIEQRFANATGTGTYPLMEKAGKVVLSKILTHWPHLKNMVIVTGKGNNAGDGFVVARLAAEKRIKVVLCELADPSSLAGDALKAYQKIPLQVVQKHRLDGSSPNDFNFNDFDLIVDAILGTGIKGKLSHSYLTVIKGINSNNIPVISVDIPTGVEADTGFVHNEAVQANITVSFVGHKKGMYTGDAAKYCGMIHLDELEIPSQFYEKQAFHLFTQSWQAIKVHLKPREIVCHKGCFGRTTVIGGSRGMSGAAILAATAAAHSGSGVVSAWVGKACVGPLISHIPEVMAESFLKDEIPGKILAETKSLPNPNRILVIGPGLGQCSWGKQWISQISKSELMRNCRQVWDADALNFLSELEPPAPNYYNQQRILTPHPGEAARLLKSSSYSISQDRFSAAQQIADQYGGVCVLKGQGTIIADDKGFQVVCPVGNSGMASGGMGDVLAGLIGGLLAQGHSLMDAAILGVCIQGEAADKAAGKRRYYRGMLASDLFAHFPPLLNP